jgi:periplasmic divalent cation tolerance protein
MKSEACLLYVTTGSKAEAEEIGALLVSEHLAACANILPGMTSVYRWEGKTETGAEVVLIVKTRRELADRVSERIKEVHSYDCPCVVMLAIEGGNPDFLNWIADETEPAV